MLYIMFVSQQALQLLGEQGITIRNGPILFYPAGREGKQAFRFVAVDSKARRRKPQLRHLLAFSVWAGRICERTRQLPN
jgi:hypothetical protein